MGKGFVTAGGGFPAIRYTFKKAMEAGGLFRFFQRMATQNACKTCALGMGGQKGGMVNEAGHFPEFCKKSIQAQAADMMGLIPEDRFQNTPLAQFEAMTPARLQALGRLGFPVIAEPGDTHYRRISWEEAITRMAQAFLQTAPERVFFYASGRASNEAAFLMQLIARAYGTPHINNCSYYCHQASGVALNQVYGSGTASIVLEDLAKADFALVVGANPASNHPRLITQLVDLRKRGGVVVIVNPLIELGLLRFKIPSRPKSLLFGSTVSDVYLQPKIGGDVALFKALLKALLESDQVDKAYIRDYTHGWDAVEADIRQSDWDSLLDACGVSKADVTAVAQQIANCRRGIFLWAMGLTHHAHGVDNILALANLALSQGWLGKPGCGLLPIRGHSNVQGVGSMGVTPALKAAFSQKISDLFGIPVSKTVGLDTYGTMQAAHAGQLEIGFFLGGNLFASNPDRAWAGQALKTLPMTIGVTTHLNEGHFHGRGQTSLLLPALARDEESQPTTQESMFNYVRLSSGGRPFPQSQMRSEVEILATLAERVLPQNRYDWSRLRSHQTLQEAMSAVVPGYEPVEAIQKTRQEFQIPGRTFHSPHFSTPDGKAHFHVTPVPQQIHEDQTFLLMTLRSEGQFNSVVYEEADLYRGNAHRNVVMMNPEDARRVGLCAGDSVSVENETGHMVVEVVLADISPGGVAMYYPEANRLVPRVLDPRSKTPAFKSVAVRLVRQRA